MSNSNCPRCNEYASDSNGYFTVETIRYQCTKCGNIWTIRNDRPKNTFVDSGYTGYGSSGGTRYDSVGRATYYPDTCMANFCTAVREDGTVVQLDFLHIGDKVLCGDGVFRPIRYIVERSVNNPQMVKFENNLEITPWHPVFVDNKWQFPNQLSGTETVTSKCISVYSFVIDDAVSIVVNGVPCATLGHNLDGSVISHPFFGTSNVVQTIQEKVGKTGRILIVNQNTDISIRDDDSGIVIGWNLSDVEIMKI